MDSALKEAAKTGDVKFLKDAFSKQPSEYFLTQSSSAEDETLGGNIFHLAAWNHQLDFIKEAMNVLSQYTQKQLLYQVEGHKGSTPLHAAAVKSPVSYDMVILIKEMYASFGWTQHDEDIGLVKPWLALNLENQTALQVALKDSKENDRCALEILLMDSEYVSCTMVDADGNTPLVYALKNGFSLVAENMLKSPLSPTSLYRSTAALTPFTFATISSDDVVRLLFKKFGDWLNKVDPYGNTMLHKWAEKGDAGPCKLLLEEGDVGDARTKIFMEYIFVKEKEKYETPLHMAARKKNSELGQILVRGYQQQVLMNAGSNEGEIQESAVTVECPPWNVEDMRGSTPLHIALYSGNKHEELVLEILSIDPSSCNIRNHLGESHFFLAVLSGCTRVVDEILKIEEPRFHMLRCNDGYSVLHCLSYCPEDTGKKLLEKYWWMINLRDYKGKTALDYAKEANTLWLIKLLSNPSLIDKKDFDWVEACKREETPAILAYIDNYQDLERACREQNDTPLHHIKLPTYKEYISFLNTPSIAELKNSTDHDGSTPLHRAIERKDMLFVKILLRDEGVERNIPNHNDRTAMDLLAKLCKENDDWRKMCKVIKVNPYLKTSYIQPGANLDQIRNTLSVVAALLATITFAAGFTLPGGLHSDTGEALLGRKAGFLVFLLADVYAMCTAMLVLFCLIWSMVSEPNMALVLVDRSVLILMQSLYGTLVAFMAGIYTVVKESSLWAVILIFAMCSLIGISANRTILNKVIVKLIPAATDRDNRDQIHLLEEGIVNASSIKNNTSTMKGSTKTQLETKFKGV